MSGDIEEDAKRPLVYCVLLFITRIEIIAWRRRGNHAIGARAMRPAAAARRETFAAIAFETSRAAIDLRLRSGDERRQAIDADIVRDHRLRLGLRRLKLRLRAMFAMIVVIAAGLEVVSAGGGGAPP